MLPTRFKNVTFLFSLHFIVAYKLLLSLDSRNHVSDIQAF